MAVVQLEIVKKQSDCLLPTSRSRTARPPLLDALSDFKKLALYFLDRIHPVRIERQMVLYFADGLMGIFIGPDGVF